MQEQGGDNPQEASPAERIESARRGWELKNIGKRVSVEERRTQRELEKRGIAPEKIVEEEDFEVDKLKDLITDFNKGLAARDYKIKPQFVEPFLIRIRELRDDPMMDKEEARYLYEEFDSILAELGKEGPEEIPEALEKLLEFNKFLKQEEVLKELRKDDPDLSSEALGKNPQLKEFVDFIDKLDPSDTRGFYQVARMVAGLRGQISERSRRILYEWLYEKIIGIPDKGSEEAPYKIGSFEILNLLDNLNVLAIREFEPEFYLYLSGLQHTREVMHELNRALSYGEEYVKYVTGNLRSKGLNFVFNEIVGVNAVIQAYEKVASYRVAKKNEWFDPEDVKVIDSEVEALFNAASIVENGRLLTKWEKERALRMGKIFFAGTQRMGLYSSFGNIPPGALGVERIASIPYEYIARTLVPFKMIATRFFVGEKTGTKRLLQKTLEEQGKDKSIISLDPDGKIGLFGLDRRTVMLNFYGAVDPQSHSWRTFEMFYGVIRLRINGREMSLNDVLSEAARKHESTSFDPLLGGGDVPENKRPAFSKDVEDQVLGQRLYLSVLPRFGSFDQELKTKIWQKIAILKPSTIASMSPDSITAQGGNAGEIWESFRLKLYEAELKRVLNDGEKYKNALTSDDLRNERVAFDRAVVIASKGSPWTPDEYKEIMTYMGFYDAQNDKFTLELSSDEQKNEQKVFEELVKAGIGRAKLLASARTPFALTIDDAPFIGWAKTGKGKAGLADEDLIRILVSDQKSFAEGWREMNGFFESPTHGAVENISKAVEGIGTVVGRATAQERMEPFIIAYLKFISTKDWIRWAPGAKTIRRVFNRPTSEIEEYFRNSYISLDESAKKELLQALTTAKAISDNVIDQKKGMTQLERIRKETGSDRLAMLLYWIRIILLLFGPIAGKEFLKMILPGDLAKSVGL